MKAQTLTGRIAGILLLDHAPSLDTKRCINRIQARLQCRICETACTRGALENGAKQSAPTEHLCDDCNVCAAHCPGGAIAASKRNTQKLLELLERPDGAVRVGCMHTREDADCKMSCLSAFPREVLAARAFSGPVSFVHGDCESCELRQTMVLFERTLKNVEEYLGEERFAKAFGDAGHAATQKTRREAFRTLAEKGARSMYTLLPESLTGRTDGDLWRRVLTAYAATYLREHPEELPFAQTAPVFTERCRACGICTRVCASKALHVVRTEEDAFYIVHFAWKCRACGVCERTCPFGGIDGYGRISLREPEAPYLYRPPAVPCRICGEAAPPEGICFVCATKSMHGQA